jgi:hypothetical protein
MLRFGIAVFFVLAAVSATSAQWSTWRVGQAEDIVSGRQRSVAQLQTVNVDQQSYRRHKGAQISIFCDEGGRAGARIKFLGKVSHSSAVMLRYKTDRFEKPDFRTNTSSDRRAVHLRSGPEAAEFAQHVSASTRLMIHTDAPGTGISRAVFETAGAADAIASALKNCR